MFTILTMSVHVYSMHRPYTLIRFCLIGQLHQVKLCNHYPFLLHSQEYILMDMLVDFEQGLAEGSRTIDFRLGSFVHVLIGMASSNNYDHIE